MANFAIDNSTGTGSIGGTSKAVTTTYQSFVVIGVGSSSALASNPSGGAVSPYNPRRGKIYDILVGTNGTPVDAFMQFDMSRMSAIASTAVAVIGALSSVSSGIALDPADGVIQAFTCVNSSVETALVYTNSLWNVGVNSRASYRWVAAPGSEFVYPATSSAGLGLRSLSGSYTGTVTGSVLFQEQ